MFQKRKLIRIGARVCECPLGFEYCIQLHFIHTFIDRMSNNGQLSVQRFTYGFHMTVSKFEMHVWIWTDILNEKLRNASSFRKMTLFFITLICSLPYWCDRKSKIDQHLSGCRCFFFSVVEKIEISINVVSYIMTIHIAAALCRYKSIWTRFE